MGGLLNLVYLSVGLLLAPWLAYRRWSQRKSIAGFREKWTGWMIRQHPERPCVWFHAVSVGEVLQLQSLIAEFAQRHPHHEICITTTTSTGYDIAYQKFPQHTINYWPFDFTWAVRRALRTVQPELVVLVELEVWPNFLRIAQAEQVPVVIINGRLSANSYRGYSRLKPLLRPLLSTLTHVAVQSAEYAERFAAMGVPAEHLTITGNIKYDRVQSDRNNPKTAELRRAFGIGPDDLVFIAGSTQDPEEYLALDTYQALIDEFPQLRLILVPRHKERFEDVASLVHRRGLRLIRRSEMSQLSTLNPQLSTVCLLDTLGELAACWGLADIAFVGGSLTQRGGQNMLEPAGYGAAVLFGPNTWNFRDIVEQLLLRQAAVVIHDVDELCDTLRRVIVDPDECKRLGQTARDFVLTQQGATAKTLTVIDGVLQGNGQNIRHAA
ncbi:3-deoxy-D-manno-octulosonic acid transferase [bacterium]|nr:3-deoxy-D-manno-octulosonic acid transferase [bacterium]